MSLNRICPLIALAACGGDLSIASSEECVWETSLLADLDEPSAVGQSPTEAIALANAGSPWAVSLSPHPLGAYQDSPTVSASLEWTVALAGDPTEGTLTESLRDSLSCPDGPVLVVPVTMTVTIDEMGHGTMTGRLIATGPTSNDLWVEAEGGDVQDPQSTWLSTAQSSGDCWSTKATLQWGLTPYRFGSGEWLDPDASVGQTPAGTLDIRDTDCATWFYAW